MPVGTRSEAAVRGTRSPRARCLNLYGKDKKKIALILKVCIIKDDTFYTFNLCIKYFPTQTSIPL